MTATVKNGKGKKKKNLKKKWGAGLCSTFSLYFSFSLSKTSTFESHENMNVSAAKHSCHVSVVTTPSATKGSET